MGLIPTFVEVRPEKLVEGPFCLPPPLSWIGLIGGVYHKSDHKLTATQLKSIWNKYANNGTTKVSRALRI